MNAIPPRGAAAAKSSDTASRPPAEAPIATMGKAVGRIALALLLGRRNFLSAQGRSMDPGTPGPS
jgi:hypothetical protein